MHFLENTEMLYVMRYKSNWDFNFTGVSFSEAPTYLLLWHFTERKKQLNKTLFLRVLKMLKTKHAIVFKS